LMQREDVHRKIEASGGDLLSLIKIADELCQDQGNIHLVTHILELITQSVKKNTDSLSTLAASEDGAGLKANTKQSETKIEFSKDPLWQNTLKNAAHQPGSKNTRESKPIYVTKPSMPPLEEFLPYLEAIWDTACLTNNGPFHRELEEKLCEYLGVKYISLFSNGTLALITALQALRITGEVITTPFSFVATTHALHWNGIKPVFADIDSETFNLDPQRIEAAITTKTTAIVPVHVYGTPCDTEAIHDIANRHGLKVIYDAAHAFGVKVKDQSILNFGDLSVLSFHATKVFNTFEGGAIVCHDETTKRRIDQLKNFGFADEVTVVGPGINAKMNEFQAAFGLLQLKHVPQTINKRKQLASLYREMLSGIEGIAFLSHGPGVTPNYSYFPILIKKETFGSDRDKVYDYLKERGICARRYFYPLISHFPTYQGLGSADPETLPVAEQITTEVLCLPFYPDLDVEKAKEISNLIRMCRK